MQITIIHIAFLLINLTNCLSTHGQHLQLFEQNIIDIKKAGDDPIIIVNIPNYKSAYNPKTKTFPGPSTYIIWKEDSEVWIQKASNCVDSLGEKSFDTLFKAIRLNNYEGYTVLVDNIDSIQNQQLKPGLIINTYNGIDSITELLSSHDERAVIEVHAGTRRFAKTIKSSQLYDGIINNEDGSARFSVKSLNYNYNIRSAVYKFYSLLEVSISQLETANAFYD